MSLKRGPSTIKFDGEVYHGLGLGDFYEGDGCPSITNRFSKRAFQVILPLEQVICNLPVRMS
jgi:hypothetical protein